MSTKHDEYISLVLQFKTRINIKFLRYIVKGKLILSPIDILEMLKIINTEYRELFIMMHLHFHELTINQITTLFVCVGNRFRTEYKLRKLLNRDSSVVVDHNQILRLYNENEELCNREILTYVENDKLYNLPKIQKNKLKYKFI